MGVKDTEEGKKFNEKAAVAKTAYDAALLAWKASAQFKEFCKADQAHEKKKAVSVATKDAKDSGMPKKPMAGFMLFSTEQTPAIIEAHKAQNDGKAPNMSERSTVIKQRWDALGEAGQKPYQEKFAADKAQYAIDMEAWNKSEAGLKYKQALLETDPKKALKEAGEPTRPQGAYLMFQNAHLNQVATETGKRPSLKDGAVVAKAKWDSMSYDERKEWQDKHTEAAAKYEADMKEFKKTDAYKKYHKQIEKQKKKASSGKATAMKATKKRKTDNGAEPQPEESPEEEVDVEESPEEESPEEQEEESPEE